jgi:hypothetical protein
MISLKRRREIVQEIREFHEVWTYGLPHPGPSKHTAEERDWVMQWAIKRLHELMAEAQQRYLQGLPPLKRKKPLLH